MPMCSVAYVQKGYVVNEIVDIISGSQSHNQTFSCNKSLKKYFKNIIW